MKSHPSGGIPRPARRSSDMSIGLRPHPAPRTRWPACPGESNEGDMLLRTTTGTTPDNWPVTVVSRNGGWWHYAGGAVPFLAELVDGTLEPRGMPPVRPAVTQG
jgi:hypothetical protein